jgi:NADH-quinone oxidoreductase subunit A
MEQYIGVLIALIFGVITLAPLLMIHHFLSRYTAKKTIQNTEYDLSKESTYECGVEPTGDARGRFSVKFFLIAMLFVIFDIETILIFPWAATFKLLGIFGFIEMTIFLAVLTIGLVYAWKRGALEW